MAVKGIDVSEYRPTVNWPKVLAAGYEFAYCRASVLSRADASWAAHRKAAQKTDIIFGGYHNLHPAGTAAQHYTMFKQTILGTGGFEGLLPPMLDVEGTGDATNALAGMTGAAYRAMMLEWIQRLHDDTGLKPFVYTYKSFCSQYGIGAASNGKCYPWPAWYPTGVMPAAPPPFAGWQGEWGLWQYTDKQTVVGIADTVDANLFNGTLPELRALVVGPKTTPVKVVDHATGKLIETLQMVPGGWHPEQGKLYVKQA